MLAVGVNIRGHDGSHRGAATCLAPAQWNCFDLTFFSGAKPKATEEL